MQILHPFCGFIADYQEQLSDPGCHRPRSCPQCQAQRPFTAHGFYTRTLIDQAFDGIIRVRRYLCRCCQRTVSLLPEFVLPYLRSSIAVIALFLIARFAPSDTAGDRGESRRPHSETNKIRLAAEAGIASYFQQLVEVFWVLGSQFRRTGGSNPAEGIR